MRNDAFESLLRREARSALKSAPEQLERGILSAVERAHVPAQARRQHPLWLLLLTAAATALATLALTQRVHTPLLPMPAIAGVSEAALLPMPAAPDPLARESAALESQARAAAAYLAAAFTPGEAPRT